MTLNIDGDYRKKDLNPENFSSQYDETAFKGAFNQSVFTPINLFGETNYNYNKLKQSFNHLNVLPNKSINLMKVGIILGQDAYELKRPMDCKMGTQSEPFAVLTEQESVVSGPTTGDKKTKCVSFRLQRGCEIG